MPDSPLAPFRGHNYLSLETFKKNGDGVKSPVWFALHEHVLYVYTEADSWKVKRIRNNPRVRMARCTVRGRVTGPWVDGTASIIEGEERRTADRLLDRKYFMKRLMNLFRRNPGVRAFIKVEPVSS